MGTLTLCLVLMQISAANPLAAEQQSLSQCSLNLTRGEIVSTAALGAPIDIDHLAIAQCAPTELIITFSHFGNPGLDPPEAAQNKAVNTWLNTLNMSSLRVSVLGGSPVAPIVISSSQKPEIRAALDAAMRWRTEQVTSMALDATHKVQERQRQESSDNIVPETSQFFGYRRLDEVGRQTTRALRAMDLGGAMPVISSLRLTTTIGADFQVIPASIQPVTPWNPLDRSIVWQTFDSPGVLDTEFDIIATRCGRSLALLETHAVAVDSTGAVHERRLGPVEIDIVCPTATPPPSATPTPTATPLPPTATPIPTSVPSPTPLPTHIPGPIHLPFAITERCAPDIRRADIVLALDASTSMQEPAGGSRTKLEVALDAVRRFVDVVDLDAGDQVAIVQFNAEAQVLTPLTDDRAAIDAAIARVSTEPTTCLPCAVEAAAAELASERRRADNAPVLVLLTDGRSNPRPVSEAVAVSASAKAAGVTVFTVRLGSELERDALRSMASRPGDYYEEPGAEDLAAIYERIAVEIPCPPSRYWGRR